MKIRYSFCLWLLIAFGQTLFAQCPPPGFPQPGNTCPTAPILCENLDGYCATINNNNVTQSFPGCPAWQLNNDEWFAFFAGTTSITIQVTPANCSQAGGQVGLQGAIYAGCGPPWMPVDLQCACTEDPFLLSSSNFVVGQVYWIVLDGCAGNVCDYSIDVLEGSTVGLAPEDPGVISGPTMICAGTQGNYSIAPVNAATNYSWSLSPTSIGIITENNNNADVDWDITANSAAELCVSVSNGCYTNPNPSCMTVGVGQLASATISGSGFVCPGLDIPVDLNISFTGEGPWEFVYTLAGNAQPAIQTSDNPYLLQVSQAGVYALESVVSLAPNCPGAGTVSGSAEVTESNLAGPDWTLAIDGLSCDGAMDLHFTLCNNGAAATADSLPVTFYLGNPLEDAAQVLGTYFVNGALATGACIVNTVTGIDVHWFPNGASSGQEIYGVANDAANLPTPYTLDSFPLTNFLECDYANNLSFTILALDSLVLDLGPDVIVCTDSAYTFDAGPDFFSYLWQDSSTLSSFTASEPGIYWVEATDVCGFKLRDSVFFSFSLLTDTQFPDTEICPGQSSTFSAPGFDTYIWAPAAGLHCTNCPDVTAMPAVTTEYTLLATDSMGCVLRDTFVVTVLPQPVKNQVFEFCPGESVIINGVVYTQPGTVLDTIPAAVGCDTLATYLVQHIPLPQPSNVDISCPPSPTIIVPATVLSTVVTYDIPAASTDCPCGGDPMAQLTQGLPPGVIFPVGSTNICYQATDSCGATNSCCFTVTIANVPEEDPCDVKSTDCVKFEILAIFQNPAKQRTYRMRVTNFCQNKLSYVAFQLPDGIIADKPLSASNYTAPSGRQYLVRNPNYSPFYSVRFKTLADSISGGQSDIFEYTLPPQADPTFIHAIARLEPQVFYETHQNVFACVVQQTPNRPEDRQIQGAVLQKSVQLFPNPANDLLFVDLSAWENETLRLKVTDALGRALLNREITAGSLPEELLLPKHWNTGMYQLEVFPVGEAPQTLRFVLKR